MPNTRPLPLDEVLRYLRDFIAVARQGSIARAAEQLFKAPSAVTRSILQLESTLGCTLFERQPRGMLLNRYGDTVLTRALRIQQELERAAANLGPAAAHKLAPLTQLLMGGHKLQLFVALAECRQISVAAQQLGLSRSAIGMSLNRLEEALGVTLFQRMGQGLLVNDQGARLLRHAKLALAEVRHIHADLSALDGCLRGTLTVGALPLCRTRLLPLAIARVLASHPQLDIRTLESPYDELARGLRHGDVDCIVGAIRHDAGQDLRGEPLFSDHVGVFCRRHHPLAASHRALDMTTLASAAWILPRQDSPARQVLHRACAQAGLAPLQPSVETGDLAIMRHLLSSTDLITACSPYQLHYELETGEVTALPVTLGDTRREIGITQRRGSLPSPAVEALLAALREVARQHFLQPPGMAAETPPA